MISKLPPSFMFMFLKGNIMCLYLRLCEGYTLIDTGTELSLLPEINARDFYYLGQSFIRDQSL